MTGYIKAGSSAELCWDWSGNQISLFRWPLGLEEMARGHIFCIRGMAAGDWRLDGGSSAPCCDHLVCLF